MTKSEKCQTFYTPRFDEMKKKQKEKKGQKNEAKTKKFTQGFLTVITLQIDATIGLSNLGFKSF